MDKKRFFEVDAMAKSLLSVLKENRVSKNAVLRFRYRCYRVTFKDGIFSSCGFSVENFNELTEKLDEKLSIQVAKTIATKKEGK
jgi:hypothetical protein